MSETFTYCFNTNDNAGESLVLFTTFTVKDGNIHTEQKLSLQSYFNSASFELSGAQLMPNDLRHLADMIDEKLQEIKVSLEQKK